jgi:phospholipase C
MQTTTGTNIRNAIFTMVGAWLLFGAVAARADGDLSQVNHIIIAMQENHSFDNYFGVIGYNPTGPYHNARHRRGCDPTDSTCVDGLSCKIPAKTGQLTCRNKNRSNFQGSVHAFHEPRFCTGPDLDHSWDGSHLEANFKRPENTIRNTPNNGFVRVSADTQGGNQITDHDTMGYYDNGDLPFYFDIAQTFAMSDRYFCAVIGQTFPNRAYEIAATSFGHLTTSEIITSGGYKPLTGTIYDLMDAAGVTWTDYYSDLPYSFVFHTSSGHIKPLSQFAVDAANGTLPNVAFIDGSVGKNQTINGSTFETDEHPPADILAGQYMISNAITALRNSPSWNDSIFLWTYDEHGGYYDHVMPAAADQGGADTPDGIQPGQCADAHNLPASAQPGGGATCTHSSTIDAPGICPTFTPTGPYPAECASFDQLGFRVPFVAVSPFSKPHYVSHVVNSHTSLLALIEKRFSLPSMTARDAHANTLEDMFDFDNSPSLAATLDVAAPLPKQSPAFDPGDEGCPFS